MWYSGGMLKKFIIVGILLGAGVAACISSKTLSLRSRVSDDTTILSPLSEEKELIKKYNSLLENKKQINILLLGIDTSINRRASGQQGFNTDVMILVSIDTETNKVLLTSVPRDLWVNGNKINALYIVYGEETLVDAFEKVTGLDVDGVIRVDFDCFEWLVNSMGGVPVNVERTFTDNTFPNKTDTGITTVTFEQGYELLTGERALTYSRSRKGNNGEGSDLMRARRQHIILQGMINAISQENSKFWPVDVPKFLNLLVNNGVYTTLSLDDVYYLWDFYKDKDLYSIESFVVDGEYVYHPGMYPESDYHAWVFVPIQEGFANLHADIQAKLAGTFVEENVAGATAAEPVEASVQD